jgi:predicted Zn-dependent protease
LIQAAHVRSGPQTFVTAGIATSRAFEAVRGTFDAAIRSFRALSRAEADAIHPNRVDFYVVKPGDTWESIARTAGENMVKPATLAIMNGGVPASPPRTGDRVRIVVGG